MAMNTWAANEYGKIDTIGLSHSVRVMQHGKIFEQGPVCDVLENPKTEYTKRLVKAAFAVAA